MIFKNPKTDTGNFKNPRWAYVEYFIKIMEKLHTKMATTGTPSL